MIIYYSTTEEDFNRNQEHLLGVDEKFVCAKCGKAIKKSMRRKNILSREYTIYSTPISYRSNNDGKQISRGLAGIKTNYLICKDCDE